MHLCIQISKFTTDTRRRSIRQVALEEQVQAHRQILERMTAENQNRVPNDFLRGVDFPLSYDIDPKTKRTTTVMKLIWTCFSIYASPLLQKLSAIFEAFVSLKEWKGAFYVGFSKQKLFVQLLTIPCWNACPLSSPTHCFVSIEYITTTTISCH